jgi:ferredoxin-type protein NapH
MKTIAATSKGDESSLAFRKAGADNRKDSLNKPLLVVAGVVTAAFWTLAIVLCLSTGAMFALWNFLYIGSSIGLGLGLYAVLPKKKKHIGRRVAQFMVGGYMLVYLGLMGRENMQIEGFFFYILMGFFAASLVHYSVAKIVGPLLFGRGWCGWACWTGAVLDLLPYSGKKRKTGLIAKWGYLRYVSLGLSVGVVVVAWFGLGYHPRSQSLNELYWLLAGNAAYYVLAIALAVLLKDNRAFCKVACPIPVLQKALGRFSLVKVKGDPAKCNGCGACTKICPMDVDPLKHTQQRRRVPSSECTWCFSCINACHRGALSVTFGLDASGRRDPLVKPAAVLSSGSETAKE